jgi:hypothetical protein
MSEEYHIIVREDLSCQSRMIADAAGIGPHEIVAIHENFNSTECISYGDPEQKWRFARQWAAHAIILTETLIHGTVVFPVVENGKVEMIPTPVLINGFGTLRAGVAGKRLHKENMTDEQIKGEIMYCAEQYARLA